jgi:alpha-aminoadipate/glutamate carrier protein LysW
VSTRKFTKLSQQLKHIRETLGYTQEEMAQVIGYDVSSINEIESGTMPTDGATCGSILFDVYAREISLENLAEDKREAVVALLTHGLLATCPECDAEIQLDPDDDKGSIMECRECRYEFEVINLEPVELDVLDFEDYDDDEDDDD